jgi:pre-mRNA-splicing factor 18
MDFAKLLSQQIAASKASKSKPASTSTPEAPTQKKYLKRSELEAQRQAAYFSEQAAAEEARIAKLRQKRKFEEEEAEREAERKEKRQRLAEESRKRREAEEEEGERQRRKRLGLPDLPPKPKEGGELVEGEEDVEDEELVVKLRGLGEPVRLFGESHRQRLKRWRGVTGQEPAPLVYSDGPIPTTLQLVPEAEMKVEPKVPKDAEGRKFLFRQLASYFTMVLKEWDIALAHRPDSVKESYQGKQAYNAMVQARENMRPLFKKMEKGEVEDGILEPVVEIVIAAQDRRYVDANDGYLTLSIGKA